MFIVINTADTFQCLELQVGKNRKENNKRFANKELERYLEIWLSNPAVLSALKKHDESARGRR